MTEIQYRANDVAVAGGLRSLLNGIVDYAGTFPPAALSLREAADRYAAYRSAPEAWMLGRFVCTPDHVTTLQEQRSDAPFPVSLLARGAHTAEEFLASLDADLGRIERDGRDHKSRLAVEQLEARLPRALVDTDVVTVRRFLNGVADTLERHGLEEIDRFLEIPLDDFLRQVLPILTGAAAAFNRDRSEPRTGRAALKMRCGGTEAADIPSADDVALFIRSCHDAAVPFKATAGLHEPLRHLDAALGVPAHGFLNVFTAAVLASAGDLEEKEVVSILLDDQAEHFRFTPDGLEWNALSAGQPVIERVRSERALSFGSCSFQEPVDGLAALGLL